MSDPYLLYKVLDAPKVTEKATLCLAQGNQIVFRAAPWANKFQIKAAVEKMFSVKVVSVQTAVVKGKRKQVGRIAGRRKDWKKAVVRLEDGQSIDFYAPA